MRGRYFYKHKKTEIVLILILLILLLATSVIYLIAGMMTSARFSYTGMMGNGMMGAGFSGRGSSYQGSGPKGYKLFRADECIMCHIINGHGGVMGPNLSHIGSKRSFSWIAAQIVDPSAHFKRNSIVKINGKTYIAIMPNHEHMPKSQVIAISKYLESLK
jgi:hypothetical protein